MRPVREDRVTSVGRQQPGPELRLISFRVPAVSLPCAFLDLGIGNSADMQRRADKVRSMLPRVWQVAEAIMAANVEVTNV